MKRILFSLFFLLVLPLNAQEKYTNPQISSNGKRVTFRLHLPDATKVTLAMSFTKKQELEKDFNGNWVYEYPDTLTSDHYTYQYIVDEHSMLDPNNPNLTRDITDTLNYFILPGRLGSLFMDDISIAHGIVEQKWYASEFNPTMKQRRLSVYLPPSYNAKKTAKFPVLYLLHGTGGDETSWLDMGRLAQIMDHLISEGNIVPMVVVMPNGIASLDAAPGASPYMKGEAAHVNADSWFGLTEEALPKEVIPFIESNYRVKTTKQGRAIAGLSLGGMHTLCISANNPTLFNYIGLFSPQTINPLSETNISILNNYKEKLSNLAQKLPFQKLQDKAKKRSQSLQAIDQYKDFDKKLAILFSEENKPQLYYIAIGKKDPLKPFLDLFRRRIDKIKGTYEYHETAGAHSWDNWRRYLIDFLPQIFK